MKSLFLSWQAPPSPKSNRAWYPIGRLDVSGEKDDEAFRFRYTAGALTAQDEVGFQPLIAFPKFKKDYQAARLFPLFQNRVMSPKRPDFAEYAEALGLDPATADPVSILSISGGNRMTDNLHVFPKVEPDSAGNFSMQFFLHGTRYLPDESKDAAEQLKIGEELQIMIEVNNPATGLAVALFTHDYHMVGFSPRYLIPDLLECIKDRPEVRVKVMKNNFSKAPLNQALLIEYSGHSPKGHKLMGGPDFTPLIGGE